MANPLVNGPGRVLSSQVNLNSGAATFSYPIELPPGPGGFQPTLELTYNSASVDEMKNLRSMGSWVGIGWSLGFGRITYDLASKEYYLDINGISCQLISSDGENYHTSPEVYYKVVRDGETWDLWTPDGTHYQFGGTSDSRQYTTNDIYYRWDLSMWEDTNSNQATISYVRDLRGSSPDNWVRSAYPQYLRYNNNLVEVYFEVGGELVSVFGDGDIRVDNPRTDSEGVPAPKIMETRALERIDIEVNENLISQYIFNYETTSSYGSNDYGGIYYSGEYKLDSITEIGYDGEYYEALPTMEFSYTEKTIHRDDTVNMEYEGNPGNPAELEWPYLTGIQGGYSGEEVDTITFSYTETPEWVEENEPEDIWTREVVTSKTIDSGFDTQSYTYEYIGEPQYFGGGWDQEYRGFAQVKEKYYDDDEHYYILHYYYTTGTVNGKDAEKLTGREYKTEWYVDGNPESSGDDVLIQEENYDWAWEETGDEIIEGAYLGIFTEVDEPICIAASPDGYVYVTRDDYGYIRKYDADGDYVESYDPSNSDEYRGIAVSPDGYIFAADYEHDEIVKFNIDDEDIETCDFPNPRAVVATLDGNSVYATSSSPNDYVFQVDLDDNDYGVLFGCTNVYNLALTAEGYIIVTSTTQDGAEKYNPSGNYLVYYDTGNEAEAAGVSGTEYVYVTDGNYVCQFDADGDYTYIDLYCPGASSITFSDKYIYVASYTSDDIRMYARGYNNWIVNLDRVEEITYGQSGNKTTQTRYVYDDYGNVETEYIDGHYADMNEDDIDDYLDDNSTIRRAYYINDDDNILNKPAWEKLYSATVADDYDGDTDLISDAYYYYDSNEYWDDEPEKGNLTKVAQRRDVQDSESTGVITEYSYDTYGNVVSETDPNGNVTTWDYASDTYHMNPASKTMPQVTAGQFTEYYTYEIGTSKILTLTDINNQVTTYGYDYLDRLISINKPLGRTPDIEIAYNYWGTPEQQCIYTKTYYDASNYLWEREFFDGLGNIVQTQACGEDGHTIISSTVTYNNRGLVDRQYVTTDWDDDITEYQSPLQTWKYISYEYDALARVITQNNADGTTVSHDYSNAWEDKVTNERGFKTKYYYDAFQQLTQVDELDDQDDLYATTTYTYDIPGNLVEVEDDASNTTSMTYDWLSRKTGMTDPDMGTWSYEYDDNGNLTSQTDAKSQTITMTYDSLNRLLSKTGAGTFTYDAYSNGKGKRTCMSDSTTGYETEYYYDARGRLTEEVRIIDGCYPTEYIYDGSDRIVTIRYPDGETVTQTYNGRGLPDTISGNRVGDIVTETLYNSLGQITEINLGNGLTTTYGYYGLGGEYDTTGGYYGDLWEIKTAEAADWLSGWDNRIKITIDHDKIDETLTHFPVQIYLSGSSGKNCYDLSPVFDEIGANCQKIAVTTDDGETQLYVEVEKWDENNEEAWLWVSEEYWAISDTEDTTIYLYYDSSHADNTSYVGNTGSIAARDVWDYDFAGVWHMTDATTTTVVDSSWESKTLTKQDVDEPLEVDSVLGNAQQFDGTDDYLNCSGYPSYTFTDDFTIEMMYKPLEGTKTSEYHRPMGQDSYDPSYVAGFNFQFGNGTQDDNFLTFNVHRGVAQGNTDWEKSVALSNDLPTESYSYAVGTFSRPSVSGYLNGDLIASTSYDYDMFIAISSFQVGRSGWRPNDYLNEEFDEIRVSEVARSAAWIKATYYTMYHDTEEKWNRLLTFTSDPVQDYIYIWDAGGNLDTRNNLVTGETETFTYDFLDRLTAVSGAYNESYEYDEIGNLKTRNGVSYTYGENGAGPHAVTTIGTAGYSYDANGNMTSRNGTAMTWNTLNQLTSYGSGYYGASFTYDGDGNRITKETCGVLEYVYVNKYYETVDGFSGDAKSRYYLGNLLVAENNCGILNYLHQDHLGSVTSSTSDIGDFMYPEQAMSYLPFGETRSGYLKTYKRFTAQHFDTNTGLYYYNARYYDPEIGRFISADTIVPDFTNPQAFNRYSYCLNNPLKYVDPSGHFIDTILDIGFIVYDVVELCQNPSWENAGYLGLDVASAAIPFVTGGGAIAKAAVHGDDIAKVTKDILSHTDDIKKFIKNPYNFRGKLQRLTGMTDEMAKGMEAHHILPQALKKDFKNILGDDFDINNPMWGAWVEKGNHQKWSYQYQKEWEKWLNENPKAIIEDVMKKAEELGTDPQYNFNVIWAE